MVIAGALPSAAVGTFLVMLLLMSISVPKSAAVVPIVTPAAEQVAGDKQLSGSDNSEKATSHTLLPLFPSRVTKSASDEEISSPTTTPPQPPAAQPPSPPPSEEPPEEPATQSSVTYVTGGGGGSGRGGGGGGGGGGSDEDDEPAPPPDPKPKDDPPKDDPPKDDPPKDDPPSDELHGVNFIDRVLNRYEGANKLSKKTNFVDKFVAKAKQSNFNLFRIPVTWESYVDNKANFLAELDYLVKTANKNNIAVWIDFSQYFATSNWGWKVARGSGFPDFVVSCYKPTKDYEHDPEVRAFWDDYYLNKVRDSSNSCKRSLDVWTLHANFMEDMIDKVDKYPNVIGYELLNEPHVWKDSHYDQLGELHTELAKKLRKSTDKVLIFTRETAHGFDKDGTEYQRNFNLEYKILPKDPAKNVMYAPHLYGLDDIEEHVDKWKDVQKKWHSMGYDMEIAVGEWATQPPQLPEGKAVTQANIDAFVKVWEREGFPQTYWAFGGFGYGEGNVLIDRIGTLTPAGQYYENSILKFYD
jgi:hypothetical protein